MPESDQLERDTLRQTFAAAGVTVLAVGGWVAITWNRPHRGIILGIWIVAVLVTAALARLPADRLLRSRLTTPTLIAWMTGLVLCAVVCSGLDGGIRSPCLLTLFVGIVVPALSFPRWSVYVTTGCALAGIAAISFVHADLPPSPSWLEAASAAVNLSITGWMCLAQSRVQHMARTELSRASRTDPLTGALNRRGFESLAVAHLQRAVAGSVPCALLVLDFDGFKRVNDRHGHAAGDDLLRWSAHIIRGVLRPGDVLGRLGGDEFAVLLPGAAPDDADEVARRIRTAVGRRIGVSVGVAQSGTDGTALEALYHVADGRLYGMKFALRSPTAVGR